MDKIFKMNIDEIDENQHCYSDKNKYHKDKKSLTDGIKQCYNSQNGSFDGKEMQNLLCPQISQTSVFLSHSYKDIEKALSIKSKIESKCKNIKVFVDSLYWQSIYDAAENLAEQYDIKTVLKHLHIMITTAIARMIQSSRYFIFLASKNSIADTKFLASKNSIADTKKTTESPWIYFELQIANTLFSQIEITSGLGIALESLEANFQGDKKVSMRCSFVIDDIIGSMEPIELNELPYKLI